ncbi:hypothetical protein J7L00_03485 [Candidatus Bathyarchaeota archaeon]|nr:hypothetical protein [Candidatus Bathyarchaeota archaeon]
MSEKVEEKPKHNRFDNIWEIRKSRGFETRFGDFLRDVKMLSLERFKRDVRSNMLTYVYYLTPESWVRSLTSKSSVSLPIWKILIPDVPGASVGAIYYIFKDAMGVAHVFRGTYGYGGSGPHESALIEEFLERNGYPIEFRGGDYLLDIIAWKR